MAPCQECGRRPTVDNGGTKAFFTKRNPCRFRGTDGSKQQPHIHQDSHPSGAFSTSESETQSLDHSRILVPTAIMAHWKRQPHISPFQRNFIEGTTFELQEWLSERVRAAGAGLLDPLIYTRHTWLEEMHDWLQTNALATSLVMLNTCMETMFYPLSSDFEG